MSQLLKQLEDPEYLTLYVRYKIWVEHKRISPELIRDLKEPTRTNLIIAYNEEWRKYARRKR